MCSSCEAILHANMSGLSDRTSSATAQRRSIGSTFVARIDHAIAFDSVQFGFSTSLGL